MLEICTVAADYYYTTTTALTITGLCPGQPGWAGTRKVKPKTNLDLLEQEIVS